MLIAVSCLSPVSTQILMPARDKLAMVCETPSYKRKKYNTVSMCCSKHNECKKKGTAYIKGPTTNSSCVSICAVLYLAPELKPHLRALL